MAGRANARVTLGVNHHDGGCTCVPERREPVGVVVGHGMAGGRRRGDCDGRRLPSITSAPLAATALPAPIATTALPAPTAAASAVVAATTAAPAAPASPASLASFIASLAARAAGTALLSAIATTAPMPVQQQLPPAWDGADPAGVRRAVRRRRSRRPVVGLPIWHRLRRLRSALHPHATPTPAAAAASAADFALRVPLVHP